MIACYYCTEESSIKPTLNDITIPIGWYISQLSSEKFLLAGNVDYHRDPQLAKAEIETMELSTLNVSSISCNLFPKLRDLKIIRLKEYKRYKQGMTMKFLRFHEKCLHHLHQG